MAHLLSFTLVARLLLSFASVAILAAESVNKSEIDRQALLSFKAAISLDPLGALRSWRDGSVDFCSWSGVVCGKALPPRVVSLNLSSLQLTGNLSPSLANLTSLARLDLGNNLLSGGMPEELGTLSMLQDLMLASNKLTGNIPRSLGTASLKSINLAYNFLGGGIPDPLATSSSLTVLNLTSNNLSGMIPASLFNGSSRILVISLATNSFTGGIPDFHRMVTLKILDLANNNLSGSIPPSLGNVSSLDKISLYSNYLGGSVPETLSQIRNLSILKLDENNLSGHVPAQLYNISSLIVLSLAQNNLTGRIPSMIGNMLPNLGSLIMYDNRMMGFIPASLANASMLAVINLSNNSLVGPVPSLGSLSDLYMLSLGLNQLESEDWTFLASLTNCTQLKGVAMSGNNLNGSLPRVIGNLSANLEYLAFGSNRIVGPIPLEVGKLPSLIALTLGKNQLVGTIPVLVQNLSNLQMLDMNQNSLSGEIPSTIAGLRRLVILNLSKNNLSGPIPSNIGDLSMLLEIRLDSNNLSGNIPANLGNCKQLVTLNLSSNNLSGSIPILLVLENLASLDLSRNSLNGSIPLTFTQLMSINVVNLSQNNFVGHIPAYFVNFTLLRLLDLSYNYFVGAIPSGGVFENATAVILDGNVGLCAESTTFTSLFPICPRTNISGGQTQKSYVRLLLIGIPPITITLFSFVYFVVNLRKKRAHTAPCHKETMKKVSHSDILKATSWLSPVNKLSSSCTSSVYIGRFEFDTDTVAIKVFHLDEHGALNSFLMECEVLRNTRHRNIMKAVTLCSTVDLENNDFKAIVFDFMANGNLDMWVHPKSLQQNSRKRGLSLGQIIRIALDVASALDYMHNQLTPPLVHCDLKPANVLLDYDMTARVGDFGSAKFLSSALGIPQDFVGVGGTIGYIAPGEHLCY